MENFTLSYMKNALYIRQLFIKRKKLKITINYKKKFKINNETTLKFLDTFNIEF